LLRQRCQPSRAIAARAVRIHADAVRQALQRGQRNLNDFVAGCSAQAGNKTGAASIVVRVAPIGMPSPVKPGAPARKASLASTIRHIRLLTGQDVYVQLRLSMPWIACLIGRAGPPPLVIRPSGRGLPRPAAEGSAF